MSRLLLVLACVATLPLSACFMSRTFDNEPIDHELVASLEPGVSTAADVTRLLGAPTTVVELGNRSAYLYQSALTKAATFSVIVVTLGNEDRRSDRVWVFFDAEDRLTHVGSSLGTHRASWAMPWNDLHDPETRAEDDAQRFGDR